jgi:endonuclease/exonuclease/phosphatase family metal-dependent hydrolase
MHKLLYLLIIASLFTSPAHAQKKQRLLTYNIRNAKGMDNKVDYDRIAAVLLQAKADIIALQEVDSVTTRSARVDVLQQLAQKTGMHAVYGAAIPLQGGKYGVALLSKEKPLQHYTVPLPGKEEERVLLVVEFKKYVVFNTHFSLTEADRLTSVNKINEQSARFQKPIYLLGDLNAEPASPVIAALQQDWTLLTGVAFTFPATTPDRCIDYIFSRNTKKQKARSATVVNEPLASDHRPVLVEVRRR